MVFLSLEWLQNQSYEILLWYNFFSFQNNPYMWFYHRKIPFIKPVCRSTVPVDQTTVFENFRNYYENPIKMSQHHCSGTRQSNWCQSIYQSAVYACAVGGDYGYCYQSIQSDCVIHDTRQTVGSYLWYRKLKLWYWHLQKINIRGWSETSSG